MFEHHKTTMQKLTAFYEKDHRFLAILFGGSIAKGWAREDSDVDFMLIATPEEYAKRLPENDFHIFSLDFTDYAGGYVDGKVISLEFLMQVADKGSEPARSAFVNAVVGFSRIPQLDAILAKVTRYPEEAHEEKIGAFYAQVQAWHWYVGEADRHQNQYLMNFSTTMLVLYASRMILAHNRLFYPYHKWLMKSVACAPDKPDQFLVLANALLEKPGKSQADALVDCLMGFTQWHEPAESWAVRFMLDSELNWMTHEPPIMDR